MDRLEHMEISRRARPIIRAAAAHIIAYYQAVNNPDDRGKNPNSYISGVVRDVYSKDRDVGTLLTRAASTITSMTTATQLIETAGTSDFINILKPASAGAVVLSRGTQFDFENKAAISVPAATAAAGGASFVGEGLPIPVRQKVLSAITLSPNKFASISSFTYDIFSHSIPNLEIMVKMVL